MKSSSSLELSVVVPVFNEEEVLPISIPIISEILHNLKVRHELIIVNDGSEDNTLMLARELKATLSSIRVIDLPRNMGHMHAISAGLKASKGKWIITIDADLQDPPEIIEEFYKIAKQNPGVDVVQSVRSDRSVDSLFKRLSARIYYGITSRLVGFRVPEDGADFRLMTRQVVDFLIELPEKNKIYRLLIPYFGFNVRYVKIKRKSRAAGKSKYSISRMLALTLDSFLNFSNRPLRLFTKLGVYSSIVFFIMSLASLTFWLIDKGNLVPGWTSIIFLLLFSNAILLTALGMLGEYIGRIYLQVLNRPDVQSIER